LLIGVMLAPAEAAGVTLWAHVSASISIYARGAAAYVPVAYICPPNPWSRGYAFATVSITERVAGGKTVTGYGSSDNLICDGKSHISPPVSVTSSSPWAPTTAARVWIQLNACNGAETYCRYPNFYSTASLVSKPTLSSPYINPQARLLVGTGGVAVKVNVRCPTDDVAAVYAAVTERVGATVTGSGLLYGYPGNPKCDNQWHSYWVPVSPDAPPANLYIAGSAWAQYRVDVYTANGYGVATVDTFATIDIVAAS